VDLAEAFEGDALLAGLLRAYGDPAGLSDEEVCAALFGGEDEGPDKLEALLARALSRYLSWAREVGRPRVTAWKFYRRLASGRASVETALAAAPDGWADEDRRQARHLAACARHGDDTDGQPLPFDDLPARLGLGRRAIDELLLRLRSAAGPRPRQRRGPTGPPSGG
jgi:hypothetical protein